MLLQGLQYLLVFWPGFVLGILHTLIPCEDKTIFIFYTFGVSRDMKEAFKILTAYGFGLLCANMVIGTIVSAFGDLIFSSFSPLFQNEIGALFIIISGSFFLIQVIRKKYYPHSHQNKEIKETFKQRSGRFRKRTSFFLGFLAGIPPCIFEIIIYGWAANAGIPNGIGLVFFFGIGTWLGLFPLASFGVIGSIARRRYGDDSKKKSRLGFVNKIYSQNSNNNSPFHGISKIELLSALILISLGVILLGLAIFGINVFSWVPPISI